MNILDFKQKKLKKEKISMVTCYDATMASIVATTDIDTILVGDSVAMVVHGHPNTLSATVRMMELHTAAVARGVAHTVGAAGKWIVADMPFISNRCGKIAALKAARKLMCAGAHSVKIEGVLGHELAIQHLVQSGIPVMGHLGLTPQSVHQLGGWKMQGKSHPEALAIIEQAKLLESLGAYSLVLECVPEALAKEVTDAVAIPTIGIGAGRFCDGQVLVLQDLLGMQQQFKPKFLRTFLDGFHLMQGALQDFHQSVKTVEFPAEQEIYHPVVYGHSEFPS